MNKLSIQYSVVIPVYNSTHSLKELILRIEDVFLKMGCSTNYEIIMVDDYSSNSETWPFMQKLLLEHNNLTIIQLVRNFGKHGALLCGLKYVCGNHIFIMDDDLQHCPEDFPKFVAQKQHDLVIGAFLKKRHNLFKKVTSNIKGWFDFKVAGKPRHIITSPFMMIKKQIIDSILTIKTVSPFLPALLFFTTDDIVNVQVQHQPRKFGKTGFTLKKMFKTFSNLIFCNSSFLLRIISQIGMTLSGLSFLFALYIVIKKLINHVSIPGWTSIMLLIALQGGLILLALGVIGEYLIRIINGIESRPNFLVRSVKRSEVIKSKQEIVL